MIFNITILHQKKKKQNENAGTSRVAQTSGDSSGVGGGMKVKLRSVRQFMKLGKQRHHTHNTSASRDSSTEDEGRYANWI